MEIVILESGGLPIGTVLSVSAGSIRKEVAVEAGEAIRLPCISSRDPVRVEVMSQVGTKSFELVPGQDMYDVPITPGAAGGFCGEVALKLRICDAICEHGVRDAHAATGLAAGCGADAHPDASPASPPRKLRTALTMRSYLDGHDALRQVQGMLHDVATERPADPVGFMIHWLEEACRSREGAAGPAPAGAACTRAGQGLPTLLAAQGAQGPGGGGGLVPMPPSDPPPPKRPSVGRRRREGVSAEATGGSGGEAWSPQVHEKSLEEKQQLFDIIRTSHDSKLRVLFGVVPGETLEKIVDAMCLKPIGREEHVIEQGGVGDFFYIVKSGAFAIRVQRGQDPPKTVFQAGVGFAFGELALLYNSPRSATVTATEASEVWCLDRAAFRNLVVCSAEARFRQHLQFLEGVEVLHVLTQAERAALAEVLEEESFDDDEAIVEQGERDDKMFIMRGGQAVACIRGEAGEVEVMQYSVGDYFGEIALLSGEPRKASVYAVGTCSCLYISRPTFLRVLGPLQSLLERNLGKYEKYTDAIHAARDEQEPGQTSARRASDAGRAPEDEEFDGSLALPGTVKHRVVSRKRERASDQARLDRMKSERRAIAEAVAGKGEQGAPREAATLAEKVAQDLARPELVAPCGAYAPPAGCALSLHAGVRLGARFADSSPLHVLGSASTAPLGEGEKLYSWQSSTKLKSATEVSLICQKGQKMLDGQADPTPNQDNCFVRTEGAITLYGVCDGHGPFGHLVSFRLSQTLPHFIAASSNGGKSWELAFKDAFASAQAELVSFAEAQGINIQASGAAASVLLLEEQTVHLAFVGDCRIMVGSWNRHDSRMIFASKDHTPDLPEEKARLQAAGSEVREVDPGTHRVYKRGSNFPGLSMSRSFGDSACAGVLQEPEYHQLLLQPTDQWYALLASDGIWEFLESEEVLGLTAKKVRLKGPRETLGSLVAASRKRWAYCCGDYCDDMTAILVQWNAPEARESKANHSLTARTSA